jgi:hypothetical protein
MNMKTYHGRRKGNGPFDPGPVKIDGSGKTRWLRRERCWGAFSWGYYGDGPGHLAYALLRDAVGRKCAGRHSQTFKDEVVNQLGDEWWLTEETIRDWAAGRGGQRANYGSGERL